MRRFVDISSYDEMSVFIDRFESLSDEVLTVPCQAFPVSSLLRKYAQGIMPPVARTPSFEGGDFDDLNPLYSDGIDLVDTVGIASDVAFAKQRYADYEKKRKFDAANAVGSASSSPTPSV